MTVERIAIISQVPALTAAAMAPVVAALQQQVDRDFGPAWGVAAQLFAVGPGATPPGGCWTLSVEEHFDAFGMAGVHFDSHQRPWAKIEYGPTWSLAASHELLEMLADPLANRILPGPSPLGGDAEVHILVEVCDPCQEAAHGYEINGVRVSDFLLPAYYQAGAPAGTRCSFNGSVPAPFALLEGGYMTWQDPATLNLWQVHWPSGGTPASRALGRLPDLEAQQVRLREWVDRETLRQGMPGSPHPH